MHAALQYWFVDAGPQVRFNFAPLPRVAHLKRDHTPRTDPQLFLRLVAIPPVHEIQRRKVITALGNAAELCMPASAALRPS